MKMPVSGALTFCVCAFPAMLAAQPPASPLRPPVRLTAGEHDLGTKRLFPSPVGRDMNGDGLIDIVVGDLRGRLTVALRKPGNPPAFAADQPLTDADGKDIDFHNW